MKAHTNIEQSKKLAEILPIESADMYWWATSKRYYIEAMDDGDFNEREGHIRAWSLTALLKCLSKIKPQVYTPILFPSESKWILQFAEYGHGNVCEVSCDNPIDACYKIIKKLHELKLL